MELELLGKDTYTTLAHILPTLSAPMDVNHNLWFCVEVTTNDIEGL